ncbi:MAG: hypothetical protein MNPFHGCM_00735 [Gemmatimonadaceae bacterium]|nr:hypothetical protein [Gemmatimonadaceae bacterium]
MYRLLVFGVVVLATRASAQATVPETWNDERTTALVRRATELRQKQLADTGLASYTASARGYLTFLAQVGEGFPDAPKIVKADELALEVYWRAPNYSKQWIVGRRDTLLLPTDINYHRDHLGIVQNNFSDIIRLGDGDEVRDVPHPMSAVGAAVYDYRIADSLRFQLPGRALDVYEVKVRPKDDRSAAAVGAVYLSREDAQIVRMAFSFTRAALLDKYLEDVSIVLDNALQEARFWLPRRQEIEIRRTGTWMDFPARGIIRGRWEICCYQVNVRLPNEAYLPGPEIVTAPPESLRAFAWKGNLLDSLPPDVREATDEDVVRIQAEARAMVRAGALARAQTTSLTAHRVSDMARISRAEGLALGGGIRHRFGHGLAADVLARYGFADHEPKATAGLTWERRGGTTFRLAGFRDYLDARDVPEASALVNSIAAQEFGTDYTEPYDARGGSFTASVGTGSAARWRVSLEIADVDSVPVSARPVRGTFWPTIPVLPSRVGRVALGFRSPRLEWKRTSLSGSTDLRLARTDRDSGPPLTTLRAWASIEAHRELRSARLSLRANGGTVAGASNIPAQELFYAGGPVSAPGYRGDRFAARQLASLRGELGFPVRAPSLSLGRWGKTPGRATLVPFLHLLMVDGSAGFRIPAQGLYPSAGIGILPAFDLLRLDLSRSIRDGRWAVTVDLGRDFWRIL